MTEKHQHISELLSRLRKLEIRLQVDKDKLKVDAPVGVLSTSLREELSRHKSEIIQYFENGEFLRANDLSSIPLLPRDGDLEVSFSQERLWFLSQLEPDNEAYHINTAIRLQGRLQALGLARQPGLQPVQRLERPRLPAPMRRGLRGHSGCHHRYSRA